MLDRCTTVDIARTYGLLYVNESQAQAVTITESPFLRLPISIATTHILLIPLQSISSSMSHSTVIVKDRQVNIAHLKRLNYARLASRDPAEVEKLLHVCQSPGFFYLDLQDVQTEQWLAKLQNVYTLSERFFDQPYEIKMKSYRENDDSG